MAQLRVGIIGLGVGRRYLDAIAKHPEAELVKVCDFNEKSLLEITKEYPGIKTTKNSDEVIKDPSINVVMIASYDQFHFEQAMLSIENGKHIFVEKPLCMQKSEAIQIRQALKRNPRLKLSSNLPLRTCPKFINLKQQINSNELGVIYHLEADYLWGRIHKLQNGWRQEMDFYSIIYGASVHMIDLLLWMSGKKPIEVFGWGSRVAAKLKHDDFALNMFKYADGSTAKIAAHGGCSHPHFHKLNVFGTKKTFSHDLASSYWVLDSEPDTLPVIDSLEYPARNLRSELISSYFDSIINPELVPLVTEQDVFDTMSVCFASQKSIDSGRVESVEYI